MADDKSKDRVALRLYNTIVIFDVYTVARSPEAAREALMAAIAAMPDGAISPTESVAKEVTMANSIRRSWLEERPWIAHDVTDAELEQLKGVTTGDVYKRFYTKQPK